MIALVALTFVITAAIARTRIGGVIRGETPEDFYRLFEGAPRLEKEAKLSRHYLNLFEQPILFYLAGLSIFVTDLVDRTFLFLFWGYVGIRLLHAAIHTTGNRPAHRAAAFIASFLVLAAVWARFLFLLVTTQAAA